ncbi:class I SAM-dependent methyltransferase [Dactylosporangium vinaceum]|uniref:O-methyltransferase n=1 Tax=Dactylosporangium vinaceum TaxID=53362 RepID=A0ABV5MCT1_9ACTN|nr:class I SAM-dependent methyltransferase [Dactylosporangium vinaceum]UAC00729.1 class I SAM-dependent methyltransferase [Dactylosporangium vinaceum]
MDSALRQRLEQLHADGVAFDAAQSERLLTRRNLEPASARLLWSLTQVVGARDAVEIGTSNGYSAMWLADALALTGGHLTSVDIEVQPDAERNLAPFTNVSLHAGDGGEYLGRRADASVDLLFLDAERTQYPGWWPHPVRVLRPGGLLVIDNVLSHPGEVAAFLALLAAEPGVRGETIEIGKGLHLAWPAR